MKKIQSETKDTLIEIKNNLQGNNTTVDEAENQINNLEHKEAKHNHSEEEKSIQKSEYSARSLWENFKCSNICFIWVPKEEEKEQATGKLFEKIMKANFPNLMEEIDMQVQEAQRIPNKMDTKKPTPRHILVKMPKVKDKEMGGGCERMGER